MPTPYNEPMMFGGGLDFWEILDRNTLRPGSVTASEMITRQRVAMMADAIAWGESQQTPRNRSLDDVEDVISFEQIMANAKK